MEQPSPVTPPSPSPSPVPATVRFAEAAKVLAAAARAQDLLAPSYRTPPRLVGIDRTVRRHAKGGAVAVRVRGRPWPAVVADMIDGVVALNGLDSAHANRVRADLWDVVLSSESRPASASSPARPKRTGSRRAA